MLALVVFYFYSFEYNSDSIFYYVFLLANIPFILNQSIPYLAHLWSIAVEEQFYIFWPWFAKMNNSKLMKNMLLLLSFLLFLKLLFYVLSIKYGIQTPLVTITTTRFYNMIFGSIAGLLFYNNSDKIKYFTNIYFALFCWIIIILSGLNMFNISSSLIDHEIISIVTVGIIITQIKRKNIIIDLDTRLFNFLGKISYGIYVYHPLVIFITYKSLGPFENNAWYNYVIVFTIVVSITIFISYLSFHFFEKRFIALKKKYSSIHSSA